MEAEGGSRGSRRGGRGNVKGETGVLKGETWESEGALEAENRGTGSGSDQF
jgi:hypothetical protein